MFTFLKKFFGFNNNCACHNCCCKKLKNKVYTRCGIDITVPADIAEELDANNYCISVTKYKGKPSCVQLSKFINNKSTYFGTLKTYMNVKSFKDNNVCNFSYNNIVLKGDK